MKQDHEMMVKAYQEAGGNPDAFKDSNIAHLIVHQNKVLGSRLVEGLALTVKQTASGVNVDLTVKEGIHVVYPVHLCFGVLPKEGRQVIRMNVLIKKDARIKVLAHCVFPNAVKVCHIMEAEISLEENAVFEYNEVHYHGRTGGIEVIPKVKTRVGKGAKSLTSFSLTKGRVGRLNIDYQAEVGENGILEMTAKVYGFGEDKIRIRESAKLAGEGSRGLIKSRIAVKENADCEVISELQASAPNARGHVDCIEVIGGQAKAKAVPLVSVSHEKAQVTHEASIGRINQKEMETLMARGLNQEAAIDAIIGGMLR